MYQDSLGREFDDDLTNFLLIFLSHQSNKLSIPFVNAVNFLEGISGVVLYRSDPFQVQMFIVQPNVVIPEHVHPNIDSYEIALSGLELTYEGQVVNPDYNRVNFDGIPRDSYGTIRIKPLDKHGGVASDKGGVFMSVQQWLNGVRPTSVEDDWQGKNMGSIHAGKITSGA